MASPSGAGVFVVSGVGAVSSPVNGNSWALVAGVTPTIYAYFNNVWNVVAGTGAPYIVGGTFIGSPTASEVIIRAPFSIAATFAAGLANSEATAGTAATGSTVFNIQKNGSTVGTITFAASSSTGVFAMASNTSFAIGDVMTIVAPASPDATLANIGLSVLGQRN